jgi:hypothetical protein
MDVGKALVPFIFLGSIWPTAAFGVDAGNAAVNRGSAADLLPGCAEPAPPKKKVGKRVKKRIKGQAEAPGPKRTFKSQLDIVKAATSDAGGRADRVKWSELPCGNKADAKATHYRLEMSMKRLYLQAQHEVGKCAPSAMAAGNEPSLPAVDHTCVIKTHYIIRANTKAGELLWEKKSQHEMQASSPQDGLKEHYLEMGHLEVAMLKKGILTALVAEPKGP